MNKAQRTVSAAIERKRQDLADLANGKGPYAGPPGRWVKTPERALKRAEQRTARKRLFDACDDAYLLERLCGMDVAEAWTLACLGNGLEVQKAGE